MYRLRVLALAALLVLPLPAFAVMQVASLLLPRVGRDIAVSGDRAFVAMERGIAGLDVSDRFAPELRGVSADGREVRTLDWVGSILYAATWENERTGALLTFDVSDPDAPRQLGEVELYGRPVDVQVVGDVAHVTGVDMTLVNVDVSEPTAPLVIAQVPFEPSRRFFIGTAVEVSGDVAFAGTTRGLHLYDVSDPTSPSLIDTIEGSVFSMDLDGDRLYLARDGLFDILDISVPRDLVLLSPEPSSIGAGRIAARNQLAVVTRGPNAAIRGMAAIDVSDPTAPSEGVAWGFKANQMTWVGDALYVTNSAREGSGIADGKRYAGGIVKVFDMSNRAFPRIRSELEARNPRDVVVRNGVANVIDNDGLLRFDVTDPDRPVRLSSVDIGDLFDLSVSHTTAFVSVNDQGVRGGFEVVDLSDSSSPTPIASVDTFRVKETGRPRDLDHRDGFLYVAHNRTGLRIWDVSAPDAPTEITDSDEPLSRSAKAVGFENGFAFVARGRRGLDVIDVRNPNKLETVGHLEGDYPARDVVVSDGVAYVPSGDSVDVIGVWDPTHPVRLAQVLHDFSSQTDIEIQGLRLYVGWRFGVEILDIGNPEKPRRMLAVQPDKQLTADGIGVRGGLVYAADAGAVRILDPGPELAIDPPHPSGCTPAPRAECVRASDKALLKLRRRDGRLRFRWKADPDEAPEFGDPEFDTHYGLCLYQRGEDGTELLWRAAMPGGERWLAEDDHLLYRIATGGPHGIDSARVSPDAVRVKGHASVPLPLDEGEVVAQVVNDEDGCWEARFDAGGDRDRFRGVVEPQ